MTVGYTRLSFDRYGDAMGVTRQREDIVALAASLGWREVTEFYEDNDVSANPNSKQPRPEFERLLVDIRTGVVTHVLCYDQDRLVRDMRQLEDVVDAVEAGDALLTSVNGDIDLLTDNGRMVARIKAAVARNEIEKLSRRVKRQKLQRARNGTKNRGGKRTFGYASDFSIVPTEAAVLVELFERKASGETVTSLMRWLNNTGVPTSIGNVGKWDHGSVSILLRRREYGGDVTLNGQVVATNAEKAIVSRALFERANATPPVNPAPWRSVAEFGLLTGLLICENCGARMRRGRGSDYSSGRLYTCRGRKGTCGLIHIASNATDTAVLEAVFAKTREVDTQQVGQTGPTSTERFMPAQAAAIEHEMLQARRMHTHGTLTRTQLAAVLGFLQGRLTAEQAPADPNLTIEDGHVPTPQDWDTWNLAKQRDWLAHTVRHIVISKAERRANGLTPGLERITIHFKDGDQRNLRRRKVLINEVAAQAGCSAITVSRALRGLDGVSDQLRQHVTETADRIGYIRAPQTGPHNPTPDDAASRLAPPEA